MVKIRISTARQVPLVSNNLLCVLIITAGACALLGTNTAALLITLLCVLVAHLYLAYRDMSIRRMASEQLYYKADDAKSQAEMRYKVMKISRDGAERRAREARGDLVASREIADDLLRQVNELHEEVQGSKTKDALIDALRRRVSNINDEYNDKHTGRRGTTLEDVYKLTGELDV